MLYAACVSILPSSMHLGELSASKPSALHVDSPWFFALPLPGESINQCFLSLYIDLDVIPQHTVTSQEPEKQHNLCYHIFVVFTSTK